MKTLISFGREISSGILTQDDSLEEKNKFKESANQKPQGEKKKHWPLKTQLAFLKEDKTFLMVLKAKYY